MATHRITITASNYVFNVPNLVIKDGNEGIGKVLTSDSSEQACWKSPAKLVGAFEHYVGEIYGGGIVFDVWKEGDDEKVLIASLANEGPMIWGSNALRSATSIADGKSNTEKAKIDSAAKYCKEYRKFSTPLSYTFSSSTVAGDPGAGFFRFVPDGGFTDSGTIYIDNLDATNNDRSSAIGKWAFEHQGSAGVNLGRIKVEDQLTGSTLGYYSVSSAKNSVIQNSGYLSILISFYFAGTYQVGPATTPVNNTRYILTFEYGLTNAATLAGQAQGNVEYDDWYLPSSSEINKLFDNAYIINRILGDKNGINATNNYWTSTEYDASNAYVASGIVANPPNIKSTSNLVRPIRLAETKKSNSIALDLDVTNAEKLAASYIYSSTSVPEDFVHYLLIQDSTLLQNGVSLNLNSYLTFSSTVPTQNQNEFFDPVIYNYQSESGYVNFNGSNQFLDFSAPLGSASTVTVEMWARLKSSYTTGMIMFGWFKYDIICTTNGLSFNTDNSDEYGITTSQVNSNNLVNNWVHYVFEMNSGTQSGNKIYINGITQSLSKLTTSEPNTANMNFNGGNGRIGGWRKDNTLLAIMDFSLFRVYKRRLTADEVFQNFVNSRRKYEILPTIVKKELVLHLDADDASSYNGSSGTWYDISGKDNNSTAFINSPTFNKPTTVYPGGYMSFDGINEKIEFPSISRLNGGLDFYTDGNFSWEAWIYCVQHPSNKNQMFMGVSGAPYLSFYSDIYYENSASNNYGNKIFINIRTTVGIQFYHFTKKTLSFDRWYHVVVTQRFDGTNTAQRIYVDGVEDQQDTVAEYGSSGQYVTVRPFNSIPGKISNYVFNPAGSNVGKLTIGDGAASGEQYGGSAAYSPFKGNIAQVRLYRKTLSASEIKNNYKATKHKFDLGNDTHGYNTHRLDTQGATNPTFSITQNLSLKVGDFVPDGIPTPTNKNNRYNRILTRAWSNGNPNSVIHTFWEQSADIKRPYGTTFLEYPNSYIHTDFPNVTNTYGILANQINNSSHPKIFLGEVNYGGIVVGRLSLNNDIIIVSVRDIYYNNNPVVAWGTNIVLSGVQNKYYGRENTLNEASSFGEGTAAYICTQYITKYKYANAYSNGTTWYLPSLYELIECYRHLKIVNNILGDSENNTSHHGFFGGHYWTSTEYDTTRAYYVDFSTGNIGIDQKTNLKRVRAVRTLLNW